MNVAHEVEQDHSRKRRVGRVCSHRRDRQLRADNMRSPAYVCLQALMLDRGDTEEKGDPPSMSRYRSFPQ